LRPAGRPVASRRVAHNRGVVELGQCRHLKRQGDAIGARGERDADRRLCLRASRCRGDVEAARRNSRNGDQPGDRLRQPPEARLRYRGRCRTSHGAC
jgi:hypothetical protein